jgi:hypothetical protein
LPGLAFALAHLDAVEAVETGVVASSIVARLAVQNIGVHASEPGLGGHQVTAQRPEGCDRSTTALVGHGGTGSASRS